MSSDSPRTSPDERQPVTAEMRERIEYAIDRTITDEEWEAFIGARCDDCDSVHPVDLCPSERAEASPAASGDALREALHRLDRLPQWSPHPDIKHRVSGPLVSIPDVRGVLAALSQRIAASPPLPEGLDVERFITELHKEAGRYGWSRIDTVKVRRILARLQQPASREGA